jgi:hypothetical protein
MVLTRFSAIQQLCTAEVTNKAIRIFPGGGSSRYAANLFKVPRTLLRRRIIMEGKANHIHPWKQERLYFYEAVVVLFTHQLSRE